MGINGIFGIIIALFKKIYLAQHARDLKMKQKNKIISYLISSLLIFSSMSANGVNNVAEDGYDPSLHTYPEFENFVITEDAQINQTIGKDENSDLQLYIMSRDSETVYQFTSAGHSGNTGPSQSQINTAYAGTSLDGAVSVQDGIQIWTVPSSGTYQITAKGASGGIHSGTYRPGFPGGGAIVESEIELTQGQTIYIVVGQKPTSTTSGWLNGSAGGGGSWVYTGPDHNPSAVNSSLIVVAGGGGGTGHGSSGSTGGNGKGGSSTQNSNESSPSESFGINTRTGSGSMGNKGIGQGGRGTQSGPYGGSGGGAGWLSSGNNTETGSGGNGGTIFVGGTSNDGAVAYGGFGGGGGSGGNGNAGAGGGGYTGGGAGNTYTGVSGGTSWGGGAGGGSFASPAASNVTITEGESGIDYVNTHNGFVLITPLTEPIEFQPQTKTELQTAVDMWIDDNSTALSTYGLINNWDVSMITDMAELFRNEPTFNDNINNWDVSNVINMYKIFDGASSFNQDLSNWDVSGITGNGLVGAFQFAHNFNGDISNWDISGITSLSHTFYGCTSFNSDISNWDVSNVSSMEKAFVNCSNFNADISGWDVSNVTSLKVTFSGCSSFNADISAWDVSNVRTFTWLFKNATSFNADISSWLNGTNVAFYMDDMFNNATNFNQDISSWDVSNVHYMQNMFNNATSFNQNISNWNIDNVQNLGNIFNNAVGLSDDNKCEIHQAFSTHPAWPYEWLTSCPNSPPVANTQVVNSVEDSTLYISLSGTDPDGDILGYTITTPPANGILNSQDIGLYTYTPGDNYNGQDNFYFAVSDGMFQSDPVLVTIYLAPVNDPPQIDPENAIEPFSFPEDSVIELFSNQFAYESGLLIDVDTPLDSLTVTLSLDNENISLDWDGSHYSNPTLIPDPDYFGTASIEICVSDNEYTVCDSNDFTVDPVNDLPSIISEKKTDVNQGHNYFYVIETHDVDGDDVSLSVPVKPSWLTLTDNILHGVPEEGHVGAYNIEIVADDSNGGTSSQIFTMAANATKTTIEGESGFRILSSPFSGVGVYSDLLDELWTQGMAGSDDPLHGSANAWTWENDSWKPIEDLDTTYYQAGTGVLVYVFADANFDGIHDDLPLDIGIDSVQASQSIEVSVPDGEWALVGNPFGVPIDIKEMTSKNINQSNVRPSIHVYDPIKKSYEVSNGQIGTGILESGHLHPFQAFWVHSPPDEKFEVLKEQRISGTDVAGRSLVDSTGSATIAFNSGDRSSASYLSFDLHGQVQRDPADGLRLVPLSNQDHLVSMFYMDDEALAINNLPYDFNADIAIDLDVMMLTGSEDGFETSEENISMSWDFAKLPAGISMMLVDNITNEFINMNEVNNYSLSLESKGGFVQDINEIVPYPSVGDARFTIYMSSVTAKSDNEPIIAAESFSLHPTYPNPFNPSTTIHYSLEKTSHVQVKIYNLMGREIATLVDKIIISGNHRLKWIPSDDLAAGVYVVRIHNGSKVLNQRITFLK